MTESMALWCWLMLCAAPFLMWTEPKRRTWLALFMSGLAALVIPSHVIGGYMLVDLAAGYAIIRHPAGWQQKGIGAMFLAMVTFHIGYLMASIEGRVLNPQFYGSAVRGIGWGQTLLLISWGLADAVGLLVAGYRRSRRGISRGEAV